MSWFRKKKVEEVEENTQLKTVISAQTGR